MVRAPRSVPLTTFPFTTAHQRVDPASRSRPHGRLSAVRPDESPLHLRRAAESLRFQEWDPLLNAADAAEVFVVTSGLANGDSPQRQASGYEAAFSVDESLWPTECRQFFAEYVPQFEELYAHRDAPETELSIAGELARRSAFTALRSGRRWHARWKERGADPDFQWCAFELTNLASEIRRHWQGLSIRLPSLGIEGSGRRGYGGDSDYEHLRTHRQQSVRLALQRLDADTQRVLRMAHGFFPCVTPYSLNRIASTLGRSLPWTSAMLRRGMAAVEYQVMAEVPAA